jgi:hypothetical protein
MSVVAADVGGVGTTNNADRNAAVELSRRFRLTFSVGSIIFCGSSEAAITAVEEQIMGGGRLSKDDESPNHQATTRMRIRECFILLSLSITCDAF